MSIRSQQILREAEIEQQHQAEIAREAEKQRRHQAEIARVKAIRKYASVRNFRGPDAEFKAYQFGMWLTGNILHQEERFRSKFTQKALNYCEQHGFGQFDINLKAQNEGINTAGGYLVPPEFSNDLIQLREQFGVFRQNTRVVPMLRETMWVPRRASGLTVFYPGEGVAVTESQKGWDMVSLTVRKYACLVVYSSELSEDAIISMGDDLAGELGYAFGVAEDTNGFNGDGTSGFANTTGVRQRLFDVYGAAGGVGLRLATGSGSGNNWSTGIVFDDLKAVAGALPAYARGRARWFCSGLFAETVLLAQKTSSASPAVVDIANGPSPTFLGFPIAISQVFPVTAALSQVPCVLGDLASGSKLGESREVMVSVADQLKFAEDQFAIKGIERVDINVHDVGNASAAGPLVGLVTKAS